MKRTITISHITTLALPVVALLLPLVQVKSYKWGLLVFADKMMRGRLPASDGSKIGAYVLLAALVLVPVAVAVTAWLKGRMSRALSLLPAIPALILIVALLINPRTAPAYGLWIYLVLALMTGTITITIGRERN